MVETTMAESTRPSLPSAERTNEICVIQPGSKHLRIGWSTDSQPTCVPHLVAYRCEDANAKMEAVEEGREWERAREEATRTVEVQVRGRVTVVRGNQREAKSSYELVQDDDDDGFHWTDTETESGCKKKFLCGEEAVHLPPGQPYVIRRPMYANRLNASSENGVRRACRWMEDIWRWVLETKLKLTRKKRRETDAVLVLPDLMPRWEVKEMVNLMLKELEFGSLIVHQESLAAMFGHGSISGCIVSLGAQSTSVCCIEDGISMPETRVTFDFGGDQISQYMHWLLKRARVWPCPGMRPDASPLDCETIDRLKESFCTYGAREEEENQEVIFYVHEVGQLAKKYSLDISPARDLCMMAYFYPKVLDGFKKGFAVDPAAPFEKQQDPEIVLEDVAMMEIAMQKPASAGILPVEPETEEDTSKGEEATKKERSDHVRTLLAASGLHMAIVESILRCNRIDLQQKLFANIILVGGGASAPGLADILEEKVLYGIPRDVSVETVNVLPPKRDCQTSVWFGGVLLGTLDFARETWLTREEWMEGGPLVGTARKYSNTTDVLSQVMSFMRW